MKSIADDYANILFHLDNMYIAPKKNRILEIKNYL